MHDPFYVNGYFPGQTYWQIVEAFICVKMNWYCAVLINTTE